jgi:hypothetical protein
MGRGNGPQITLAGSGLMDRCFLLFNTGTEPVISKNGLLTTVGYDFPGQKPVYALEGSIAVAGSAVKWARDQLGIIKKANEIGELASKVDGTPVPDITDSRYRWCCICHSILGSLGSLLEK